MERRDNRDVASNTLMRIRMVLRQAIHEAQRQNWVQRNVAELAHLSPRHERSANPLNLDETRAWLTTAVGRPLEAGIHLMLSRGLRPGEMAALQWATGDLDDDPPTILVANSRREDDDGRTSCIPPKTRKSRRTLVLPQSTAVLLRAQHERIAELRTAAGERWQDNAQVFPNKVGARPRSDTETDWARRPSRTSPGRWSGAVRPELPSTATQRLHCANRATPVRAGL